MYAFMLWNFRLECSAHTRGFGQSQGGLRYISGMVQVYLMFLVGVYGLHNHFITSQSTLKYECGACLPSTQPSMRSLLVTASDSRN